MTRKSVKLETPENILEAFYDAVRKNKLVCIIGTSNICHTLSDLEGPYKTKQECIDRAYEIGVELPNYMPNFQALKYKCVEVDEEAEDKVRT